MEAYRLKEEIKRIDAGDALVNDHTALGIAIVTRIRASIVDGVEARVVTTINLVTASEQVNRRTDAHSPLAGNYICNLGLIPVCYPITCINDLRKLFSHDSEKLPFGYA